MREILFRGREIENNTWAVGSYIGGLYDVNLIMSLLGDDYEIKKETLGQYIGIKDKNNILVFEDDILETDDYIGWVYYNEENTCFSLKYYDMHNEVYEVSLSGLENVEVIGNIHDNPELLGREK